MFIFSFVYAPEFIIIRKYPVLYSESRRTLGGPMIDSINYLRAHVEYDKYYVRDVGRAAE